MKILFFLMLPMASFCQDTTECGRKWKVEDIRQGRYIITCLSNDLGVIGYTYMAEFKRDDNPNILGMRMIAEYTIIYLKDWYVPKFRTREDLVNWLNYSDKYRIATKEEVLREIGNRFR